ncbi:hypothetical protein AB0B66_38300 [Catellatospora sp. NPDC049111]|uniref:hypothetical protein n=1 Tax=Catellatospora sp. NPDC049111 TaxID=3155271 RepID=UPI00340DE843
MAVQPLAFHPTLPLLANGTSGCDRRGESSTPTIQQLRSTSTPTSSPTTQAGELVILRAEDGTVLMRQQLQVNDHMVAPSSHRSASDGRAQPGRS